MRRLESDESRISRDWRSTKTESPSKTLSQVYRSEPPLPLGSWQENQTTALEVTTLVAPGGGCGIRIGLILENIAFVSEDAG